jgi:hypothetical protein
MFKQSEQGRLESKTESPRRLLIRLHNCRLVAVDVVTSRDAVS